MFTRWQSATPDETLWAEWDGVYVVFHRPSSKTHVLNAPAAALLQHVLRHSKCVDAAARELAARQGETVDEDFMSYVASAIGHLEQLGLVERT